MTLADPFGTYAPRGLARGLVWASRRTVAGRGGPRRAIWTALKRNGSPAYDVIVNGCRMRLHPEDNSVERGLLLRPQKYCRSELAFLTQCLSPGMAFVDAGANIGAFTLPLAQRGGAVVAIEPAPVSLDRLRCNVSLNEFGNVAIVPAALSDATGTSSFSFVPRDTKLSGFGVGEGTSIVVATMTLADLLKTYVVDAPYVLKIDVEGHEDAVLMPFFLATAPDLWPRHVLIETIERQAKTECVRFMMEHGYREVIRTLQNTGLTLPSRSRPG